MSGVQDQVISAMDSAKEAAVSVGERVSDFFQGNPFATDIGHKIELATDATRLTTENWGLNMEICDYINNTTDGGRDAIRAIRKRLNTQISKNNDIVMYTLTVLETCVKNCDYRFLELVMCRDFINELVKLAGPKCDATPAARTRILSLIQSWNDAFREDGRLLAVGQIYDELKAKGVEFPAAGLDSASPIITPKQVRLFFQSVYCWFLLLIVLQNTEVLKIIEPLQPIDPTPQQLEKLRKELDVVISNLKVFREMLSELTPGKEDPDDVQLLTELHSVCKEMQTRILDLIRTIVNDEVTYELLVINDELNNVFEKYDRYMTNRSTDERNLQNVVPDTEARSLSEQLGALQVHDAKKSPER
ncbi:unnamed protein product [Enterobius vermicularis]|uniref:VHS domain-containing protein n=1 Tax=Enterobius vermicularis TaxID=51028 RepID=A0A0N4VDL9_ENTVE|nr:unnamed protein product [Enterobius vermicularis]